MTNKPDKPDTMLTGTLVAEIAGMTMTTLIQLNKEGKGPPRDPHTKRYPAKELGMWLCKERSLMPGQGRTFPYMPEMTRATNSPPPLPGMEPAKPTPSKTDEETRLKRAQADKVELELAERAGQLVSVEDVNAAWVDIVMRVKAKLTRMPSALAQLAYGKSDVFEVQEVLESGVREALEELSEDWRDATGMDEGE